MRAVADTSGGGELTKAVRTALPLIVDCPEGSGERTAEAEQPAYEVRRPRYPVRQEQRAAEEGRKQKKELREKKGPYAKTPAQGKLLCGQTRFRREEEDGGNHETANQEAKGKAEEELMAVERSISGNRHEIHICAVAHVADEHGA